MNGEVGNENNEVDEDEVESVDSLEDTIVLSEDADDIDTVGVPARGGMFGAALSGSKPYAA